MIRYQPLPAELFKKRRQKLAKSMPDGSLVLLFSADQFPTNADAFHRYVPDSNFYYLTGLDQADGVYLGFKSNQSWVETLFIPESTPQSRLWEGEKHSVQTAQFQSGCDEIKWIGTWKDHLANLLPNSKHIYLNLPFYSRSVPTAAERWAVELEKMTQKPIDSISFWIAEQRAIKSTEEVEAIKRAIQITRDAFISTAPKVPSLEYEYQLEAELSYHFIRSGAEGHAFEPIIAGGIQACTLHYTTNHARLNAGELVLMDFGANWGHYKADITRVLPISGHFTDRQRTVYEAVYHVLNQSKKDLRIGTSLAEWKDSANRLMQDALISLGQISSKSKNPAAETKIWFPHSIGHHLGLDVHDPCPSTLPIQAGMILTCEPGIYLPEEKIGIRLETDLYVTDQGIVDLGEDIPLHWKDIEELMNH